MRAFVIACSLVWSFQGASQSINQSQVELGLLTAETALLAKDYPRSIFAAQKLIDSLALSQLSSIIMTHKILASAHCELGHMQQSREHFQTLLTFSKDEILNYPLSQRCLALYEKLKSASPLAPLHKRKKIAAKTPVSIKPYTPSPSDFAPLGWGQKRMGEAKTAKFLFWSESLALAAVGSSFLLFKLEENDDGGFENPRKASQYRIANWASLGILGGLISYGFVHALAKRKQYRKKKSSRLK